MTAEEIVRALAAIDACCDEFGGGPECQMCGAVLHTGLEDDLADHRPTCPWRLAREWVASGPSPEELATVPDENARRARLYDALWDLAYHQGRVALSVSGKDGATHNVVVGPALLRPMWYSGPLSKVEAQILEVADGD